jgi:RNA polymerase primary sigma factor
MKSLTITSLLTKIETESFRQYLNDISMIKPLTKDEETELLERLKNGDESAKDELIIRNLRFVISVAKKYQNNNTNLEDIINEGNIGLIVATQKYDVNSGFKFISYAVWWIRKYIIEYLNNDSKIIRLPNNKVDYLTKVSKKINDLEQKKGNNSCFSELILTESVETESEKSVTDLVYEYEAMSNIYNGNVDSLNRELFNNDGDSSTLEDTLSDTTIFRETDNGLMVESQKQNIMFALNKLKERDKKVMMLLFGLNGDIPMTLKEVAEEVDLSSEMIRLIRDKSLKKLKKNLSKDMFVL